MATFTAGTSFTDGVTGDVTAAKLNALVANATPLSNFITDRTAETSIATDDLVLISDTSESGALNKMTVANLMKAEMTGTINSTAGTITTGVIPTLTSTTLITSGTGTAASPAIVPTGDTNTGIFFPAADTIAFSEGGTESMRIDSSGNVGIGTTSPSDILHVSKANGVSIFESTGISSVGIRLRTNSTDRWQIGCPSASADLAIYTGAAATERLRIDSSGNVGVGNTSASTILSQAGLGNSGLVVGDGSGSKAIAIYGGNASPSYLLFADGTSGASTYQGSVKYDHNGDYMSLQTIGSERLRIDSSGNVGIGTTSPSTKLHVASGNLRLDDNQYILWGGNTNGINGNNASNLLAFYTNSTERLRIGSDGQIGIGGANYGTSGQVLTSNGSGSAPSWQTNAPANGSITYAKLSTSATEADNVDKRTAKAWVNFQGTGTVAIRNEFNVSSITDNGTGDYTVNLRSSLPNSNFCVLTCISRISGSSGEGISSSCITRATNSARINTHTSWIPNKDNAYSYDVDTIMVQIIL